MVSSTKGYSIKGQQPNKQLATWAHQVSPLHMHNHSQFHAGFRKCCRDKMDKMQVAVGRQHSFDNQSIVDGDRTGQKKDTWWASLWRKTQLRTGQCESQGLDLRPLHVREDAQFAHSL